MNKPTVTKKPELPEILYESPSYPGEQTSPIPYIESDEENVMPVSLFIFEYFDTGELEPDERGKPAKIIDQIPHQYIDMAILMKVLSSKELDRLRVALGMKPLNQAKKEGQIVLDKVMAKQDELKAQALATQDERIAAHKEALEKSQEGKKTEN